MKKPSQKMILCCIAFLMVVLSAIGCSGRAPKQETTLFTATTPSEASHSEATASEPATTKPRKVSEPDKLIQLSDIPDFSGKPFFTVNEGKPFFTSDEIVTESFENYSKLDSLGRCGTAFACVGTELMPENDDKGEIGYLKPSGWQTVKYDSVDGEYLYNRCHLIAFSLTGESANEKNLITGTRYLNIEGMLPFELKVHDYVAGTQNHVMYRVTPFFEGNDLLAKGVLMEGYSVEDKGKEISFNVFCYNLQPNIKIDYTDGKSEQIQLPTTAAPKTEPQTEPLTEEEISAEEDNNEAKDLYILNTNTKKFHYPYCDSVNKMSAKNKKEYSGTRDEIIDMGYSPCKRCNP